MKKFIGFFGLSFSAFFTFSAFPALGAEIPSRVDISYSITSGTLEGEVNETLEIKRKIVRTATAFTARAAPKACWH